MLFYTAIGLAAYLMAVMLLLSLFRSAAAADRILATASAEIAAAPPCRFRRRVHRRVYHPSGPARPRVETASS